MFVYWLSTKLTADNFTTSATPNTEIDSQWIKPGTRNVGLLSLLVQGKGAALTALSGIAFRFKKYTTTASTVGGVTPTPSDVGAQACKATAGQVNAGVTAGTGGPTLIGGCGCGGAGPGGWVAENPDAMPTLEGSATQSIDLFVASPTASMAYEATTKFVE